MKNSVHYDPSIGIEGSQSLICIYKNSSLTAKNLLWVIIINPNYNIFSQKFVENNLFVMYISSRS